MQVKRAYYAFSVIALHIPEEQKQPEDEETDETDHEVAMEIGHFSATGAFKLPGIGPVDELISVFDKSMKKF